MCTVSSMGISYQWEIWITCRRCSAREDYIYISNLKVAWEELSFPSDHLQNRFDERFDPLVLAGIWNACCIGVQIRVVVLRLTNSKLLGWRSLHNAAVQLPLVGARIFGQNAMELNTAASGCIRFFDLWSDRDIVQANGLVITQMDRK